MKNIVRTMNMAIAATGESVSLLIEPAASFSHGKCFSAALVNEENGETMTHPDDWMVGLAVAGTTVEDAIQRLDALCGDAKEDSDEL